jgi:hypothetical protein
LKRIIKHIILGISALFLFIHSALPHHHILSDATFSYNRVQESAGWLSAFKKALSINLGEEHLEDLPPSDERGEDLGTPVLTSLVSSWDFVELKDTSVGNRILQWSFYPPEFIFCALHFSLRAPPAT